MVAMKWWLVGLLGTGAISCGGDDEACKEADDVAAQIRQAAEADGLTGAPCLVETRVGLSPSREADYQRACARYLELRERCEG
jgi:hypothetical protein